MITEIVLLNFIFWEILCHTGYPTESLGFSQRKIDVDFPFCLLRGNVRGKKNPPSYELLSLPDTLISHRCIRSSFFGINSLLIEFFGYIAFKVVAIS